MASVIKMLHSLKSNHLQGNNAKRPPSSPSHTSSHPHALDDPREEPEGATTNDLMNRRKVSISKSGRYRESNKKRTALPEDTKETQESLLVDAKVTFQHPDKASKNMENERNKESSNNKENEKNTENCSHRQIAISVTDGHAVADEIESLARTLTKETDLDTNIL